MRYFSVQEAIPLQDFLLNVLRNIKKTKIKQLLKFGSVLVNGRKVTWYRHSLKPHDKVEILDKERADAQRLKSALDLKILFEDSDILVAEKPAGLLTMGTEREKEQTLYFKLNEYVRSQSNDKKGRIFIVHRLDREASGLLVFAKNETSKRTLQGQWKMAVKKYYAVTEGVPEKRMGTIENYLREDKFKRVYQVSANHPEAQLAITHYRMLDQNKEYALLEVTLDTGRKNQIRVHLSGLGYPIAGDKKYGAKTDPCQRLALHAYLLSFPHPRTGELKTFQLALPKTFKPLFPNY